MIASQLIYTLALLYIPAMVANMAPVFAAKYNVINWLNIPIDLGLSVGGKRLLGGNKTLRGFLVGTVCAAVAGMILFFLIPEQPYDTIKNAAVYGMATGAGALVGDSVKSFFKRRRGINSGEMWIPFDQIDFVIGATAVAIFFVEISVYDFLVAILIIGLLSYVVSKIGFALHIKKNL